MLSRYVKYYVALLLAAADAYETTEYHDKLNAVVAEKRNWTLIFQWISDPVRIRSLLAEFGSTNRAQLVLQSVRRQPFRILLTWMAAGGVQ